jgi:hypothetical protein
MIDSWSNDDRVAFNAWLNTDLGQKFVRTIESRRPKIKGEEINALALSGASCQGYDKALEEIDSMRRIKSKNATDVQFVDTQKD